MIDDHKPLVSFVIPCLNEELSIDAAVESFRLSAYELSHSFGVVSELILIDDGSIDGTWSKISSLSDQVASIIGVRLSRTFGQQAALTCGYAVAHGDAIISLDADLQDPPAVAVKMVGEWLNGSDIVLGRRRRREGEHFLKRFSAYLFYRVVSVLGGHVSRDVGEFRLISRRVCNVLLQFPESNRFLRGLVSWVGFRTSEVAYVRPPRTAGASKYDLLQMVALATHAILSCTTSTQVQRYVCISQCVISILVVILLGGCIMRPSFVAIGAMASMIFLFIASLGLQSLTVFLVARIHEQCLHRPLYVVMEVSQNGRGRVPMIEKFGCYANPGSPRDSMIECSVRAGIRGQLGADLDSHVQKRKSSQHLASGHQTDQAEVVDVDL